MTKPVPYRSIPFIMSEILPGKGTQENFANDILAHGPGAIAVVSYDNLQILYCNKQFEHTIGGEKMDVTATSFAGLLDEAQQLRLKTQLKLVCDNPDARSRY